MPAQLTLDLPWVEPIPGQVEDLVVQRGRQDVLTYEDGIVLEVVVLTPANSHR